MERMAGMMMMAGGSSVLWQPAAHRCARIPGISCHPRGMNSSVCRPIIRAAATPTPQPLDLTQENVEKVLLDARSELLQLFDTSVGITGVAELADLDGPFLKLRLQGRFWHQRSVVLARLANYLQQRIPEIVEVEIEEESQLDDSAANFWHS